MNFVGTKQLVAVLILVAAGVVAAQAPAPTLKSPASPRSAPDADGFIRRWLLLEPIASTGLTENVVREAVKKEYFPKQFTIIPRDGEKVMAGAKKLTWHAADTTEYNVNLFHFARSLGKPTSDVQFWAAFG